MGLAGGGRGADAMLITRTPLRISLGGGGTDLPSYYRQFGGIVISAAINKYVYIGINRTFADDYLLKYSELERVREVADISHPIIREALTMHAIGPYLEIVSLADIPAGTGLGSSGTFTVGLLKAIYAFKREHVVSGKWIVDFFFPEIRLAIEVDGSVHNTQVQRAKDLKKDSDCMRFDITVLRLRNAEIFGDRDWLIEKLRASWREAKDRENRIIGTSA